LGSTGVASDKTARAVKRRNARTAAQSALLVTLWCACREGVQVEQDQPLTAVVRKPSKTTRNCYIDAAVCGACAMALAVVPHIVDYESIN